MALGGGGFTLQNKVLPGTYINFVSAANANAVLSDRGIAAMGVELDWGKDNEVIAITIDDLQKRSLELFGYDNEHEKLTGLRELFINAETVFLYKLNSGGEKATNDYATANHSGIRGNDLKITITKDVDDTSLWVVKTILDAQVVDEQIVSTIGDIKENKFVSFKDSGTLEDVIAKPLSGGTNGTVSISEHQDMLDKMESYAFNTIGTTATEETIKKLYVAFCKRLRDEVGKKFQLVLFNYAADYEGVINVKNEVEGDNKEDLVYWVTGANAGCAVNKSLINKEYDGKLNVKAEYTQSELIKSIKAGEFVLHKVNDDIRVLVDINSLVTETSDKGEMFKENQVIRVIDQIANDIAVLFNTKYLGVVPNDQSGRTSLWMDIVKHHMKLEEMRAIENFKDSDIEISQGDNKKTVVVKDVIEIVSTMAQLYMTVTVA